MSGGSLEYSYFKVGEIADLIRKQSRNKLHIAFAAHLDLVSKALHDLEWALSGDRSPEDAEQAITEEAKRVLKDLQETINEK